MPADASPLESSASHAIPIDDKPRAIPRIVSLIALVGVLVLTGLLFFRVMALFLVPLFLAGVLVVVFEPVFKWFACKLPGKKSLPALCTTVVILLAVLIPCVLLGWRAYVEVAEFAASAKPPTPSVAAEQPDPARPLDQRNIFIQLWNADYDAVLKNAESVDSQEAAELPPAARFAAAYEKLLGKPLDNAEFARVKRQLAAIAGEEGPHSLLVGLKLVGSIGLGLLVMTVAVFYFFVDGPAMIKTMMHLSPLDDAYEEELLERFSQVSRAVVVATVLSAVVQGLLAGIGYFFVLDGGPLFLLTVTTMVMAMVPFVGAMAVWGFVAVVLFIQGNTVAAVGLAIYGAAIVSTVDNVIKPIVLHGQSKLHPLLALLSVLGGVTALGPIGILVGPMLVAFLQALLTMLRKELESLEEEGRLSMGPGRPPQPEPLAAGGKPTPTSDSDDPELDCK